MLEVSGLSKSFGSFTVLTGVGFSLNARESLALIGPNGAGKSTCFNIIGGQLKPTTGSVKLEGREIGGVPAHAALRRDIGRTFQTAATFGSMTVIENVQMAFVAQQGRHRSLFVRAEDLYRDEAAAILDRVGLSDSGDRLCGELAYGDVKRVEFAIALARRPRLMLMDEPTAGMAVRERFQLMDLVARVVEEEGIALLFTEHDMDVVFNYADRILVLDRGCLIFAGAPDDVRVNADVKRVYLGEHGSPAPVGQTKHV